MTNDQDHDLPFSQRNGLAPIPPQLKVGEISDKLRRLLWYAVHKDIERNVFGDAHVIFKKRWTEIARDLHVFFFERSPESFSPRANSHANKLKSIFADGDLGKLFDLVEFLLRHDAASSEFRLDTAEAFVHARAAYRVIDGKTIIAIGNQEEAGSILKAIDDTADSPAVGAHAHLIEAGKDLRNGDWADSIRHSIHAVEAVVKLLNPSASTLGPALNALERKGYLHGSLKKAFLKLYGFASDEDGLRHAMVFKDKSNVDETDALFMLGACASFVSYLLARSRT